MSKYKGHRGMLLITSLTAFGLTTAYSMPVSAAPSQRTAVSARTAAPRPGPVSDETARTTAELIKPLNLLGYSYDEQSGNFIARLPKGVSVPAAQSAILRQTVPAIIHNSRFSAQQLSDVLQFLTDRAWSADAKNFRYGFFYDARTDTVRLDSNASQTSLQPLVQKYGTQITYTQGGGPTPDSRTSDAAPHHGGSFIRDSTTGCSSGFSVKNSSGTRYTVTAGHCFENGAAITDYSQAHSFGTVSGKADYPAFDMELIGGSTYSRDIYVNGGATIPVESAADPAEGGSYCRSGEATGEHCGLVVVSTSVTMCYEAAGCTAGLSSYTGADIGSEGDSGGPFYAKTATPSAKIRGIHVAHGGGLGYIENWSYLSGHLGVSIVTTTL